MYGQGTCLLGEIIELGVKLNLIDKAGAWYSYKGHRIGQGKENVRQHLQENKAIADEIEKNIRHTLLAPMPLGSKTTLVEEDLGSALDN